MRSKLALSEEKLNAVEGRSHEWNIRVFGVKESKGEDIRKMLAKHVLLRHNLGSIVTLKQALNIATGSAQ